MARSPSSGQESGSCLPRPAARTSPSPQFLRCNAVSRSSGPIPRNEASRKIRGGEERRRVKGDSEGGRGRTDSLPLFPNLLANVRERCLRIRLFQFCTLCVAEELVSCLVPLRRIRVLLRCLLGGWGLRCRRLVLVTMRMSGTPGRPSNTLNKIRATDLRLLLRGRGGAGLWHLHRHFSASEPPCRRS